MTEVKVLGLDKNFAENLLVRLRQDWPDLRLRVGRKFAFRPPKTICYVNTENWSDEQKTDPAEQKMWRMRLLHEVGHAALKHRDFVTDIERLKLERAAWEQARVLYERYLEADWGEFDEGIVEADLDSYRDWLHQRSKCRKCGLTCYQTQDGKYHCPRCEQFC